MVDFQRLWSVTTLALLAIVLAAPIVSAQDSIMILGASAGIQNVAETDWAISTAGKGNSFNSNFKKCASHSEPGCGLSTGGNSWNLMAYRLDSLLSLKLSNAQADALGLDGVEAFVHGRFWSDIAPNLD